MRAGYDPQATRYMLSDSAAALCPMIEPYGWQVDIFEAQWPWDRTPPSSLVLDPERLLLAELVIVSVVVNVFP